MRRRWLRRRLFWVGVVVLLYAAFSLLALYEWARERVVRAPHLVPTAKPSFRT